MTWITPLFLVAGLAVAAPILFHMWQRTPRGRQLFSSVMFLAVSPPRITQRSRIEHWLLLMLRAAALLLIALGFARPVWRTDAQAPIVTTRDRTVAILVDVSASLQRAGFWESVQIQAAQRLKSLPADVHLGLFTFDERWRPVVSYDEADRLEPAARRQVILDQLAALKPRWGATRLGAGLAQTVQALREYEAERNLSSSGELWLISDFTAGSDLAGLAGIDWPESMRLMVMTPEVAAGTNAGMQWVESPTESSDVRLRVRVTNVKHSTRDRFEIAWEGDERSAIEIYVPAGQSRTVLVSPRPADVPESVPLRLSGDDHDFDNRLWTAKRQTPSCWVLYLGHDAANNPAGARFFLEQAMSGVSDPKISVRTANDVKDGDAEIDLPAFAVWTDAAIEPPGWLRGVIEQGGTLLAVPGTADDARLMLAWQGLAAAETSEAEVNDYSLLSDIDFEDPLFATFAEARFADFTGIHFWKHRRVALPASFSGQVLARFDNRDPFLIRQPLGEGRMWTLTSSWQPSDSQLARSSKFAPLLFRWLEQSMPLTSKNYRSFVGSAIRWPFSVKSGAVVVQGPDGQTTELADAAAPFAETSRPGLYRAKCGTDTSEWAINVAPEESKTDPLPIETLERFGVSMASPQTAAVQEVSPSQQRQIQLEELERRQSLWRWCLLAGCLLLLAETAWAGMTSRVPMGRSEP